MVKLSTLGRLGLEGSSFRQTKPVLLLTYLAVEGRQPRRRMADLFWPDGNGMKSLSMAVTRLKQAVPGCCDADATHVWTPVESDVGDLEDAIGVGDVERCIALYRGPFLDGVHVTHVSREAEEWVVDVRERLAARVRSVLLTGAERLLAGGALDAAATLAARAASVAAAPVADPGELRRLDALLRAVRHPMAVAVREELEELGSASSAYGTAPGSLDHVRLPADRLVGRERELALLGAQFAAHGSRVVTILGPGGAGKTRLALEACAAAARWGQFEDGVYVVMLETLSDERELPTAISRTLTGGTRAGADTWRHLADVIGTRHMLLMLDNFEHVRSAAPQLNELVATSPHLILLVTSRQRLGVAEEHVLPLGGLEFEPPPEWHTDGRSSAASQLLTERALQARIDLDVERHSHAFDRICRSLEGLPLGLELAAGMLRMMAPGELADLIENDPGLLETSDRSDTAGSRHGSLGQVAEASWRLLPSDLCDALTRLSVFVGEFRRRAAAEALGVGIVAIRELVDRSWLTVAGDGRLHMHPYLHAFVRGQLAVTPDAELSAKEAHAEWYAAHAASLAGRLRGPEQLEAFAVMAEEHGNLDAALTHLERRRPVRALELAVDLGYFWSVRGHHVSGLRRILALLDSTPAGGVLIATAWNRAGHLARRANDYKSGGTYFEKGLALAEASGDHSVQADSLIGIGACLMQGHGDYEAARERYQTALSHASRVDDYNASCEALRYLGFVHTAQGHYLQGKACYEEALSLAEVAGDVHAAAKVSINLATVLSYLGEHARARLLNTRSLDAMRAAGDTYGEAVVFINLAMEATASGDLTASLGHYSDSYALFRKLGDRTAASQALNNLANVHLRLGQPREAQELLVESLDLVRNTGDVEQTAYASFLYASALLDLGDRQGAKARLDACIELCRSSNDKWALMRALLVLARWHTEGGQQTAALKAVREAEQLAQAAGDKSTLKEVALLRRGLRSASRP